MKANLTDKLVAALEAPASGRKRVWDTRQSGLSVAVTVQGSKSFYVAARLQGRLTWRRLGLAAHFSVAQARAKARQMLAQMGRGEDPKPTKPQPKAPPALTFAKLARRYQDEYVSGLRNWRRLSAQVEELVRAWGSRRATDITRRDVLDVMERVLSSRGNAAARNVVFGACKPLFNWALERDLVPLNPAAGLRAVKLLGAKAARDRVLADDELRRVWHVLGAADEPFATIVRLLALTGCRRSEIADLRWSEVDFSRGLITIPAERMKAGKPHEIPLTPAVASLLQATPRRLHADRVFKAIDFAPSKRLLDAASGVSGWVMHDLRRTLRTGLAELGIDAAVAERVLAHVPGGVQAVYDRANYRDRKRDALERWEARLLATVGGRAVLSAAN